MAIDTHHTHPYIFQRSKTGHRPAGMRKIYRPKLHSLKPHFLKRLTVLLPGMTGFWDKEDGPSVRKR